MRPKDIHGRSFRWTLETAEQALLDVQERCAQINRYNRQGFWLAILAMVLRAAPGPIPATITIFHEIMHAVGVYITGGEVTRMTTHRIFYTGGWTPLIAASAYFGESAVYYWVLIKRPWSRLGKFLFGVLIIVGWENTGKFFLSTT